MKRSLYVVMCVLCLLTPTWSLAADPPDWHLRFAGSWTDIDAYFSETGRDDGSTLTVDGEASYGVSLGIERRLSDLVGVEFGVDWAKPDVVLRVDIPDYGHLTLSDSLDLLTLRAGLNLHLLRGGPVDLYLGPAVAWINTGGDLWFSTTVEGQTASLRAAVGNDWGWGGVAGLDVVIGDAWTVGCAVSYFKADLDVTDVEDGGSTSLDLDPFTARLGFGARF